MARKRRKRPEPAPSWAWMLLGLSMGLAVALVVYLRAGGSAIDLDPGNRLAAIPTTTLPASTERSASSSTTSSTQTPAPASATSSTPSSTNVPTDSRSEAEASAAGADDSATPDELGFYTLLRDAAVPLPDGIDDTTDRADLGIVYEIQAGSFRSYEEADERKATLAIHGIESRIQTAMVNNSRWHRVIVGPVERAEMNSAIRVMRNQRIDFMQPRPVGD